MTASQPTTNAAAFAAAQAVIPGGVDSPVRAFGSVGGTPRFMAGARGPYLTDVEGNEYVDLVCSWGKRTLSAVSEHYGVTLENAHTSAADALAAVQVADALAARYEQLRVAPTDLHERQVRWKAEQAESFEQYLRRKDPQATVSRHWPVEAER